jgi:hypothetical protein
VISLNSLEIRYGNNVAVKSAIVKVLQVVGFEQFTESAMID